MDDKVATKPLQRLSYQEKIADDYQWFKDCTNYFISLSSFTTVINSMNFVGDKEGEEFTGKREYDFLRRIYHNEIPAQLFTSFLNPLKTNNKSYLTGAKIRPLNIIKSNIDFISSNYRKRTFNWQCVNLDTQSYNEFQEKFSEDLKKKVAARFTQLIMQEDGQEKPMDLTPDTLKQEFSLKYKDVLANKAQKFMTANIEQNHIHEVTADIFLDYLITGEPVSYRGIEHGKLKYRRVDRKFFEYDKTVHSKYIHDAEWQQEIELLSLADIVDMYYDKISDKDWEKLDVDARLSVESFKKNINSFMSSMYTTSLNGKIPVYHTFWKSRKKIRTIRYYDEDGILVSKEVSEEYVVDERYEEVTSRWVNCVYKTDKVGELFFNMGEYEYDSSDLNDYQKIIMPYNGFKFAHYYDEKVYSVLKLGIPYLVLFLICHFSIEKLLGKNKDRILLIDWNVIPKQDGWDEEKFMYYANELGYAFINRDQIGADKSFNQYTSVDMSTLGSIFELVRLAESYQSLWDNVIGVPRQMKGQNYASDEVGTTNSAVLQSGITIDYIYQKFEDFLVREMECILELSKYIILEEGTHTSTYSDDGFKLLELTAEEICFSKLKIVPVNNAKENKELDQAKQYAQTVNQQDPLQIIEIMTANSIAELKKTLGTISAKLQEQLEATASREHENAIDLVEKQKDIMLYENMLAQKLDDYTTDNKIRLDKATMIPEASKADLDKDGIPDLIESQNKSLIENRKLDVKQQEIASKEKMNKDNNETAIKTKNTGSKK